MFPNIFQNVFHNPYSNHYHNVPNPRSNATFDIPHGLTAGKQIFISGVPMHSCDRFQINLETRNGGTALHINPRFSGPYGAHSIVRNADLGGWGAEENDGPFPFHHNQPFEVSILAEQHRYRVSVNGSHAFDFNHRAPIHDVVRLNIQGDVQVNRILFAGGDNGHGHHGHNEVQNPHLPFATPINRGPAPGRLIQVSGHVPHSAGRFVVNLQNGHQQDPNEIPLHLSVRFNDPSGQPVVVRTNRSYGSWGHEERDGHMPFQRGNHFDMLILVEQNEFKVAINGQHFTSFRHRNPLHEANHIGIYGDVQIHSIKTF